MAIAARQEMPFTTAGITTTIKSSLQLRTGTTIGILQETVEHTTALAGGLMRACLPTSMANTTTSNTKVFAMAFSGAHGMVFLMIFPADIGKLLNQ